MAIASRILVTGFPGFRASHLVHHLLVNFSNMRVVVVVSARNRKELSDVQEHLGSQLNSRLDVLEGEPLAIDMGLSGEEYTELTETVSVVHHVSLPVELTSHGSIAESSNVASMRETLEFGLECRNLQRLLVHSSVFVSGDREGLVKETELNVGQKFPFRRIEELAVAELMAARHVGRLPVVVLRASQVVGEPFAGRLTALDGLYRLILFAMMSPKELLELLPSSGDTRIYALEVDTWLAMVAHCQGVQGLDGKTLHLSSAKPTTLREAFHQALEARTQLLNEGFEMPVLGRMFLKDPLLREQLQNMVYRPRTFLDMAYHNVSFDTRVAQAALSEAKFERSGIAMNALVRQVAKLVSPSAGSLHPPPRAEL